MSSSVVLVGGEVVHVGGEVLDLTALGQNEVGLTSLVGAALGAVRHQQQRIFRQVRHDDQAQ